MIAWDKWYIIEGAAEAAEATARQNAITTFTISISESVKQRPQQQVI